MILLVFISSCRYSSHFAFNKAFIRGSRIQVDHIFSDECFLFKGSFITTWLLNLYNWFYGFVVSLLTLRETRSNLYYTVNSSSPDFPPPLKIILLLPSYICKRVPETIPFSTSPESLAEAELSGEEADGSEHAVDAADEPRPEDMLGPVVSDAPHPPMDGIRTLLHPLEAAQRSRTTTPSERAVCIS